ncbi:MAG TPA: phosphatase PAP2 family protein [Streptosporangiaceae bacterium]|nr:phosphatase PAP2 family protein [Streptosporangiaceae bacterium]
MGRGIWRGSGRPPDARRQAPACPAALLPGPFRLPAAALLAACVSVTVLLGISFAGHRQGSWLDAAVDPPVKSALEPFPALLNFLAGTGALIPVNLMALALVLACVVTRRWSGAVLAAVGEPTASTLTEYGLKPLVHRTIDGALSLPSGHATGMFALAATCAVLLLDPPGRRVPAAVRLLLACLALLAATAVAIGMVARGAHYFTDTVAGAAVGTGMVLAWALILDRLTAGPPWTFVPGRT